MGENSVVTAGAIVTTDVPTNTLVGGAAGLTAALGRGDVTVSFELE